MIGAAGSTLPALWHRLTRDRVLSAMRHLECGQVVVDDRGTRVCLGDLSSEFPRPARVIVHHPQFWSSLLLKGTLGAAESWMRGEWDSPNLLTTLRIVTRNEQAVRALDGGLAGVHSRALWLEHRARQNTRAGARRNISAHYDLGNDFFAAFLDSTMTYSSAVFERPEMSLEEASRAKYERACRRIGITSSDRVLEIGGGWGGFALHAASHYGCQVTTTTISRAQHELASQRIAEAGLADRVSVVLQDYRDLRGEYDAIVSIEMLEAVGSRFLSQYFSRCSQLLQPAGRMFLQTIVVRDDHYRRTQNEVDVIKKYVFPGGELPSLGAIAAGLGEVTDLRVMHVEDIAPHYAETIRRWDHNLSSSADKLKASGYSTQLMRLWHFYLAYCHAGFSEGLLGCLQLVLGKPRHRQRLALHAAGSPDSDPSATPGLS